MKLSIVLGVCQMVLGITMSYKNATFHNRPLDVWHVFIPQMIFMNAIFGYLVIIILMKWAINWDSAACRLDPNCIAPDLKTVLINMFMSPGTVEPLGQLYTGQAFVQVVLLVAALVAVPWMLLPKPLILKARHDKKAKDAYRPLVDDGETADLLATGGGEESHDVDDDFNFADMFVNQMIHTIEFVLGAVSNTASYLRLWALSLAHAELSDVFLEKLLYMTFETGSSIAIMIGFFLWVAATLGVLMFMESLSAFLHALRLHWVEFQNKFYNLHASGRAFVPFSFSYSMEESVGAVA
jgi:V-type H+-transporting ATPase subunit a